jgi:hypothetical protein
MYIFCENTFIADFKDDEEFKTYFGLIPKVQLKPEKQIKFSPPDFEDPCPGTIGMKFKQAFRAECVGKDEC